MIKLICTIALFFACFLTFDVVGMGDGQSSRLARAKVCFIDFRIDFVIGKTEDQIGDERLCHYTIGRATFLGLLSPRPDSEFYQAGNVRAKVIYSHSEVYFIDANGVVRFGSKKFAIDKVVFTKELQDVPVHELMHAIESYGDVAPGPVVGNGVRDNFRTMLINLKLSLAPLPE